MGKASANVALEAAVHDAPAIWTTFEGIFLRDFVEASQYIDVHQTSHREWRKRSMAVADVFRQYQSRRPLILLGGFRRPSDPEMLSNFDSILDQWVQAVPDHRTSDILFKSRSSFNETESSQVDGSV